MDKVNLYLSVFMIVVLLCFSALAFFTDILVAYVQGNTKYLLGAVLFLYALIRMSRLSKRHFQTKTKDVE
jgi:hypothetical protein